MACTAHAVASGARQPRKKLGMAELERWLRGEVADAQMTPVQFTASHMAANNHL